MFETAYVSMRTVLKHKEEAYETSSIRNFCIRFLLSLVFKQCKKFRKKERQQQQQTHQTVHRNSNNKH